MKTQASMFAPRSSGGRVRRILVGVFAVLLLGALLFPTAAGAANKPTKVDVCHATGSGSFKKLNVSENAVRAHLKHGDGLPGDPVPGKPGYVFNNACVPADLTPPVVTAPADQTVPATSTAGAVVEFTAPANDAVNGPLTATCNWLSGSTFPIGETTVTCTATDAASNTGSATFKITVEAFIGGGYLVRATSTDSSGNLRVISELLDTNGDGVPSTGDTAKFYEYPRDFTGTIYGTFDTTECVLDDIVEYNLDNPSNHDYVEGYGSGYTCFARWLVQGQYTAIWEYVDYFFLNAPGESLYAFEYLTPSYDRDILSVHNSVDSIELESNTSPADDTFVDIEFNFAP